MQITIYHCIGLQQRFIDRYCFNNSAAVLPEVVDYALPLAELA